LKKNLHFPASYEEQYSLSSKLEEEMKRISDSKMKKAMVVVIG